MPYVYSTLTSDNRYTFYAKGGADMPIEEHSVTVKGGTGVMNDRLVTPLGVATEISDHEASLLKEHPVFKLHAENGFVKIDNAKQAPEKAAADMQIADGSAPLSESHFKKAGGRKKTNEDLRVGGESED